MNDDTDTVSIRTVNTCTARFDLMMLSLAGEPPPPPPPLPGRVHRQPWRVPDDEQQLEREQAAAVVWWQLAREGQQP